MWFLYINRYLLASRSYCNSQPVLIISPHLLIILSPMSLQDSGCFIFVMTRQTFPPVRFNDILVKTDLFLEGTTKNKQFKKSTVLRATSFSSRCFYQKVLHSKTGMKVSKIYICKVHNLRCKYIRVILIPLKLQRAILDEVLSQFNKTSFFCLPTKNST